MVRSKLGLKALGLCALVLGLMAVVTSAAQAEATSNWFVGGVGVNTSGLNPSVGIKEIENKDATLLTKIAGIKVEFLCTAAALVGAKLEKEGKVTSGGKVQFSGCITKLNGVTSAPCLPHTGATNDVIETNEGKGLLVLHAAAPGGGVTRIEPVSGKTLVTIELGKECAIGTKVPVIGKLALKDAALKTEAVEHLIAEGPLTELWAISETAEHVATIDGTAIVILTGAHSGLKWSGTPG